MIDLNEFDGDESISASDILDMIENAKEERAGLVSDAEDAEHPLEKSDLWREVALWDDANRELLEDIEKECGGIDKNETCIRGDLIDDYLDEFVNDCYTLPKDLPNFITLSIDYDALKQDYETFELGGNTYYVRCV